MYDSHQNYYYAADAARNIDSRTKSYHAANKEFPGDDDEAEQGNGNEDTEEAAVEMDAGDDAPIPQADTQNEEVLPDEVNDARHEMPESSNQRQSRGCLQEEDFELNDEEYEQEVEAEKEMGRPSDLTKWWGSVTNLCSQGV